MTFAIIRDGVIVDSAQHDTFRALADWVHGHRRRKGTSVVILDLQPGESPQPGEQVVVTELRAEMASLVRPRPAS